MHEAAVHDVSAFATLTYRDEDLPAYGSLDLPEFTRFVKRLRKQLGDRRVRYYACGEYGEKNGRPHYHLLLFGGRPCSCDVRRFHQNHPCGCQDRDLVLKVWGHGGVDQLGTVSYDSARYCADYIGKSYLGKGARAMYFPRLPPFQVMSQGIGRQYVDDNAEQLRENLGVTVHGVPVGLPRYYATRLSLTEEDWEAAEKRYVPPSRRTFGVGCAPDEVAPAREQREKDYLARLHMFRKGKI